MVLDENKQLTVTEHKYIDELLNILSYLFAGKKWGEYDTGKLRYWFYCEGQIEQMKEGYYTINDIAFLENTIEQLRSMLSNAEKELKIAKGGYNEEKTV